MNKTGSTGFSKRTELIAALVSIGIFILLVYLTQGRVDFANMEWPY